MLIQIIIIIVSPCINIIIVVHNYIVVTLYILVLSMKNNSDIIHTCSLNEK